MPRAPKKPRAYSSCIACMAIARSLNWQNPTPHGEERTIFRAKQLHWKGLNEVLPLCYSPSAGAAVPDPAEQSAFT